MCYWSNGECYYPDRARSHLFRETLQVSADSTKGFRPTFGMQINYYMNCAGLHNVC